MNYRRSDAGLIVYGDAFGRVERETIDAEFGVADVHNHIAQFPLILCDPPYGEITNEEWDHAHYNRWMEHCVEVATTSSTIILWGGVGKRGNRPFPRFASTVEDDFPEWEIKNWITWGKKRAYGVKDNYLFTREECIFLTRGTPTFNIPLLETKRGYAGYNKKYPAKSEFFRRTNVWTDVTEIMRGKIHPCQKPDKLYEILIQTHSSPGDVVYDPCAGSLVTLRAAKKLGRRYCVVEKDAKYCRAAGYPHPEESAGLTVHTEEAIG